MQLDILLTDRRAYSYENYVAREVAKRVECRMLYLSDRWWQRIGERPLLTFKLPPPEIDFFGIFHIVWIEGAFLDYESKHAIVAHPNPHLSSGLYLPLGVEKSQKPKDFDIISFTPLTPETALPDTEGRRLDIFGEHAGNNWLKKLKGVYLHQNLPYSEKLALVGRAREVWVQKEDYNLANQASAAGCELKGLEPATPLPSWDEQVSRLVEQFE